MGFMTVVSILNDGWDQITKYPEKFVENISHGMNGYSIGYNGKVDFSKINSYSIGNHCNPMDVCQSFHADAPHLFYAGQNMMYSIGNGFNSQNVSIEHREEMLKYAKRLIKEEENEIKKLKSLK